MTEKAKSRAITASVVVLVLAVAVAGLYRVSHRAEGSAPASNGLRGPITEFEHATGIPLRTHRDLAQFNRFPAVGAVHWKEFHPVRGGVVLSGYVEGTDELLRAYFIEYCTMPSFVVGDSGWGWRTEEDAQLWLREHPDVSDAKIWGAFDLPGPNGSVTMFAWVNLTDRTFEVTIHP